MTSGDTANPPLLPVVGSPSLVLLRHGRTVLNDQNRLQGSTDAMLDVRGREQSKLVGDYIRVFFDIDEVISSPPHPCAGDDPPRRL